MILRLTNYLTALIFLSAMSVIYQNVVTPWLQPPHIEAIAVAPTRSRPQNDSLQDLFPDSAWQRGVCKQLQSSDGMLLFKYWEQISDDEWKLWPITLVIGRGMSGDTSRTPVVIDAPEGADIKFTQSLDVMSGGAPPIDRGRMIGPVHIYRSAEGDDSEAIDLRTANVGIDSRKIWTSESIEMKVGKAELKGRDLTIHLAAPTAPGSATSPAVVDRMELIYLDRLVMPLEKGGLWKSDQAVQQTVGQANEPAMIALECGGRVEYDFALDQLFLSNSVSLIHHVPGHFTDRFDCDSIELQLNDPNSDSLPRESPLDWLVRITAIGSPAVADLPSFNAEMAAERIELDAERGLIKANGKSGIHVRRHGVTARLAGLVYQFDPKQPKSIEAIDVPGAGMILVDDPAIPVRKAEWRDGFQLKPAQVAMADNIDTNVDLWVSGEFHAWLTDGGELQAQTLRGTFKPASNQFADDAEKDAGESSDLVPDRFEMVGGVRIDTTAIAAETKRLLLYFVTDSTPPPKRIAPQSNEQPSPLRQWVVQPGSRRTMVDPVARPRPVIRGDLIIAKLAQTKSGITARNLKVTGSVQVVHNLEAGDQLLPARLSGELLQLENVGVEDVLHLESGPNSTARFDLGDGFFVGPRIQVLPNENTIWIDAAGEFQLPTAALPTGLAGESNTNAKWIKPPHCRWKGEMIFDGRTAVLTDGVDLTATLLNGSDTWDLQMTGDRLQVDLANGVQVRDMQAMKSATIQSVSLMQSSERPVLVQATRRAADGVLEAKHLVHAMQLTFIPVGGGDVVGQGPGWYRGWTIPQNNGSLLAFSGDQADGGVESPLSGVHLVFSDSMRADLTARQLDFLRGVRVGVRGVSNWNETFDARSMDAISMGESTLDCDRLRFNVEPGFQSSNPAAAALPTPWEMESTGGVVFRTRNDRGLLEGTASRASYASSKDLFTVDGSPGRAAIFRQTRPDGSLGPEGQVRTMSIRPRTLKIENLVLERLNLATPPQTGRR